MNKRDFIRAGAAGAAGSLALGAPSLAQAQTGPSYTWKMATGWAGGPDRGGSPAAGAFPVILTQTPYNKEAPAVGFRNGDITVIANLGHDAVDVPRGEILLSSSPLDAASLAASTQPSKAMSSIPGRTSSPLIERRPSRRSTRLS